MRRGLLLAWIQQCVAPDRLDHCFHICYGGIAAGDRDTEHVPSHTVSPPGGVSEQISTREMVPSSLLFLSFSPVIKTSDRDG
ncbi:unnamed protein product [Eruca vesicaria subsp. sativa]|uniref:Secreted protein n=1 Tax=Eruca vesicaria subsp. sativa TaxID=29727 RepID=A0ABC8K8U2_ERUVS|nr:unnamed protein product [Eruca vesicaria subsp. sativa]